MIRNDNSIKFKYGIRPMIIISKRKAGSKSCRLESVEKPMFFSFAEFARGSTRKKSHHFCQKPRFLAKIPLRAQTCERSSCDAALCEKNVSKKRQLFRHAEAGSKSCRLFGTPGAIRTRGLSLRRRTLYPAELRAHIMKFR